MTVITNPKMKKFVEAKVNNDFGLTVDQVAEKCKNISRFSVLLGGNVAKVKEVLNAVKSKGVSPAFFAAYEKSEGYNSKWGWLNHTSIKGNPVQDAESVASWIVTQSKNTTDKPAWIDYANYKDFVPNSVKVAGNNHFKAMTGGIGKVVIAGTAAATWAVYYPNGLKASYNGVQDYADPITVMYKTIEEWGGSLDGGSSGGGGTDPDPDPKPPEIPEVPDIDFNDITQFLKNFGERITKEIEKMLTVNLYDYGQSHTQGNKFVKVDKTFKNIHKIKPTLNFKKVVNDLINSGLDGLDDVIGDILPPPKDPDPKPDPDPDPDPKPDPDPPSDNKMYFPINPKVQGVNFWVPPNYPNMDYGGYRSGRRHWAYDIGTLGNPNVKCYAVRSGKVLEVSNPLGIIVIKHSSDSYYSQYMHLNINQFKVKKGDTVKAGQQIGVLGGTGGYAIHLHIAISKNGVFGTQSDTINQRTYLKVTGNNKTSLSSPE